MLSSYCDTTRTLREHPPVSRTPSLIPHSSYWLDRRARWGVFPVLTANRRRHTASFYGSSHSYSSSGLTGAPFGWDSQLTDYERYVTSSPSFRNSVPYTGLTAVADRGRLIVGRLRLSDVCDIIVWVSPTSSAPLGGGLSRTNKQYVVQTTGAPAD